MVSNLGPGDNSRARASSSAAGGDGGRACQSAEDSSDSSTASAFSMEAMVLLAGISDHPRVVSALHTAVDDLRSRLMPAAVSALRAWLNQMMQPSPVLVGVRAAYNVGWGIGRKEAAEPPLPNVVARNKSVVRQHILRSTSGGAH